MNIAAFQPQRDVKKPALLKTMKGGGVQTQLFYQGPQIHATNIAMILM